MIKKIANVGGTTIIGFFVMALFIGRYLGLVGVLGLLARLVGWYKSWLWTWIIFVIIGFISAALLEKCHNSQE